LLFHAGPEDFESGKSQLSPVADLPDLPFTRPPELQVAVYTEPHGVRE